MAFKFLLTARGEHVKTMNIKKVIADNTDVKILKEGQLEAVTYTTLEDEKTCQAFVIELLNEILEDVHETYKLEKAIKEYEE